MGQTFNSILTSRKLYIIFLVALDIFLVSFPIDLAAANIVTSNLSNNVGHSLNQKLLQSNISTYVVWTDTSNSTNGNGKIFFRVSNDSGINFSKVLILSNKTGDSNLPDISAYKNNVYVSWEDESLQNSDIFFRASPSNGATFGNILNISNDTISSTLAKVASNKNYVYVVWVGSNEEDPKNFEIFLRRSNDSGQSFGPIVALSKSAGDSTDPHIVVPRNSNNVYVVYTDCDATHDDPVCGIYFVRSTDNGVRFESPQQISIVPPLSQYLSILGDFHPPIVRSLLSAFGINVHEIMEEHNSVIPLMTSSEDGKDVYVLWQDDLTTTGASDIFFRKSNDFGKSFDGAINLSNTPGISRLAQIVALGSDIYVVWSDTNTAFAQFDVFFKNIGEHGKRLGKTINLSSSIGNSAPSDVGLIDNSSIMYVAWTEKADIQNNILLAKSIDAGNTFEEPVKLATKNSLNPVLIHISYNNNSGLVWTEYGKENADIYFARIN